MLEEDRDLKKRDRVDYSAIPRNAVESRVDLRDLILERLVKSIGEECGQEAIEYLANSRAEAFGE